MKAWRYISRILQWEMSLKKPQKTSPVVFFWLFQFLAKVKIKDWSDIITFLFTNQFYIKAVFKKNKLSFVPCSREISPWKRQGQITQIKDVLRGKNLRRKFCDKTWEICIQRKFQIIPWSCRHVDGTLHKRNPQKELGKSPDNFRKIFLCLSGMWKK